MSHIRGGRRQHPARHPRDALYRHDEMGGDRLHPLAERGLHLSATQEGAGDGQNGMTKVKENNSTQKTNPSFSAVTPLPVSICA